MNNQPASLDFELIDSHCHIHDSQYEQNSEQAYEQALKSNIRAMICVGTSVKSSQEAIEYCQAKDGLYYSLAIHPHEVANLNIDQMEVAWQQLEILARNCAADPKFVAIGETGLDYYYHHKPEVKNRQVWLLQKHLKLAESLNKPLIFHIREAFFDFWPLYDQSGLPGVVHSFSSTIDDLQSIIARKGLYVGLNGIMTFTKDEKQLESAKQVPLKRLMLETDSPYLTPKPLRGKINTPANVRLVAEYLSDLRKEPLRLLADQTSANARILFGLSDK
ncbi:TatD family hydrolase [Candidatus Saccharibacteria bacterium]|nr:TatD family hydrolase [Candidatus Saccharibacteria bacterium]